MCRTGPSSWQRQHSPAPAERPSDQRQIPARVTLPPGAGREPATMGHRSPPSPRHTTERFQSDSRRGPLAGASNSQAPGGLPTLHRSTLGTSSSTSGTVLTRLFLSVSTCRAPPLANTVRVSRRRHRGPGQTKVIVVIASSTRGFTAYQADTPPWSAHAGNRPKVKIKGLNEGYSGDRDVM